MNHQQLFVSGFVVLAVACASSTAPPRSGTPAPSPAAAAAPAKAAPSALAPSPAAAAPAAPAGDGVALCDVVCEQVFVEPLSDADGREDVAHATKNANDVLDAARPRILACFEHRVRARPANEPFMTLGIVVGTDGKVQKVDTTGGAPASERAVRCVVELVRGLSFEAPRGHGTMRVEVPFTLRKAEAE